MQKPSILKRVISLLFRTVVVIALMALIAVGTFQGVTWYLTGKVYDFRSASKEGDFSKKDPEEAAKQLAQEAESNAKNMKNVLFVVEGADGLSRYCSLVMMNKETKAVDILLIPLHIQVTVGGRLLKDIQSHLPESGSTVSLDDVARVYGDDKYSVMSDIFSEILGVKIDGYDILTQDQFESLLDLSGKVSYQFDNMLSYRDSQQNLQYFQSGAQQLDGAEAAVVMSHLDGTSKQESSRLERCNTFLESWTGKVLGAKDGKKLIEQIEGNAASSQGRSFTEEKDIWSSLTPDALTIRILQGAESQGVFTIDSQKAKLQIATLVKQSAEYDASNQRDSVESIDDDQETVASSKDYYIELYNAAFHAGLASEWETFLEGEGYNISLIDSYQDEGPISTTRIIVSQEGIGQDLLKYFPDAEIETDDISTGGDIQVYLGTDSINVGVSDEYSGSEDRDSRSDDDEDSQEETDTDDKKKDQDEDKDDDADQDKNDSRDIDQDDDTDTDKDSKKDQDKDSKKDQDKDSKKDQDKDSKKDQDKDSKKDQDKDSKKDQDKDSKKDQVKDSEEDTGSNYYHFDTDSY